MAWKIDATDVIPDSTHRFVTDAEKAKWNLPSTGGNGQSGYSGYSGVRGLQGFSGYSGQKGDKGEPGTGSGGGDILISMISVKNFGAKGDGQTDDAAAINTAVQYCFENDIRTLYFPQGTYIISKPILLRYKKTPFSTINLLGESNMWSSVNGSRIVAAFNDSFAIGIQMGKATTIAGLTIQGRFSPQSDKFFQTPFTSWGTGARDSRYSPHAGIAIDYATNVGFPPDGGYPSLQSEYNIGYGSMNAGSTGVRIINCVINNFVVGICCSPNGQTQNNEEVTIDYVDFTNCKTAVSGGQAQEKNNVLSNFATWGGTHTVFSQGVYGNEGHAGNWIIEKGNLAGNVVQLVQSWAAAWYPITIRDVFGESIGRFGNMGTQMNAHVTDVRFDFQDLGTTGYSTVINATGMVKFDTCIFRYYNGKTPGYPIVLSGGAYYNCLFGGTPIDTSGLAEYYNCIEDGYSSTAKKIGESRKNIVSDSTKSISTFNRYGDFSLQDKDKTLAFQGNTTFYKIRVEEGMKQINQNDDLTLKFNSDNGHGYSLGGLVILEGSNGGKIGYGIVSDIEDNIVSLKETTYGLGKPFTGWENYFYVSPIYPNHASLSFTGDVTSANEISNVKILWGANPVGATFSTASGAFKIISYDGSKFKTIGVLPSKAPNITFK